MHLRRLSITAVATVLSAAACAYLPVRRELSTFSRDKANALNRPAPSLVTRSVVAVEDPDFRQHSRFYTVFAVWRAFSQPPSNQAPDVRYLHASLTDQLARRYVAGRAISRIPREILFSAFVDATVSKDAIEQTYVSNVYLGKTAAGHVYGVSDASRAYFNQPSDSLTPAQCAVLIDAIRNPHAFSPTAHSEVAIGRRLYVLDRMLEEKVIDEPEYVQAKAAVALGPSPLTP